jgi:ABC-type multidrug transport system permease subunit
VLPATVWQRELAELTQRRSALLLKLAYPLVVGIPLLLSTAPPFYAAMALTMLAVSLAALGSGAVLARERATGLQVRYRLLPIPAGRLLLERVAASAAVDLAQLVPLLVVIALLRPGGSRWWPAVLVSLIGCLLLANVAGAVASSLASTPGEVMLVVLLPLLPAFYLSGLFAPPTNGLLAHAKAVLPFGYLHDALTGALGGTPAATPATVAIAGAVTLAGAAIAAVGAGRRTLETDA